MRIYNCAYCGKENKYRGVQYANKYCNNKCSAAHMTAQHKAQWLSGVVKRYERDRLRIWLSEDRGYKCECCGISDWYGQPITLQVDHIDGNAGDDGPNNLRLICPNCHSQSDTFSGRNKGNGRAARGLPLN